MAESGIVFTVGHSNRSSEELVEILAAHDVDLLVDVRRHPGSRRNPQFNRDALSETLAASGIGYRHEEALGGRRSPREDGDDGRYGAWRSDGFRAYARHLNGEPARRALDRLEDGAGDRRPAVMCAEADPERCHRKLVADHLVARGLEVVHLLERERAEPHRLRETARVEEDGRVFYPARQTGLFDG